MGEAKEKIYKLRFAAPGRYWFIGASENDIWVWDRDKQDGLYGDTKVFRIGEGIGAAVEVRGPWNSNPDALFAETGERV